MTEAETLDALRALIVQAFPELAGRHLPHKARVTAVHGAGGTGATAYSVDLEPLTPFGAVDAARPPLKNVPLDVPWAAASRGVLALPAVGAIVRVAFYDGLAAHPFIDAVLGEGLAVPAVNDGELLVQHSASVTIRVTADGTVRVDTNRDVIVNADGQLTAYAKGAATVRSDSVVRLDAPLLILPNAAAPVVRRIDAPTGTVTGPGNTSVLG